jgi:hypothetical protein
MASIVNKKLGTGSPSTASLMANVKATEVGSSTLIVIAYTAPTSAEAQHVAAAYARAYVGWSNNHAKASLQNVQHRLIAELKAVSRANPPNPQLEAAIRRDLGEIRTVQAALPNSATAYGLTAADVSVKRTGIVALRSAGIGAFVGSIIGVVVLLLMLSRSPQADSFPEAEEPQDTLDPDRPEPAVHRP